MESLLGWIGLIFGVVGIIVSVLVSRHYYRRSIQKELTAYIDFEIQVLGGIDAAVRKELRIFYRNVEVEKFFQLQLLIANTGQRSIASVIKPLTLPFPKNVEILDGDILYVSPQERQVSYAQGVTQEGTHYAEFNFPLLNSGEFFLVNFFLKGHVVPSELILYITAEDLPPLLHTKTDSSSTVTITDAKTYRSFKRTSFFVIILLALSALSICYILLAFVQGQPEVLPTFWFSPGGEWSIWSMLGFLAVLLVVCEMVAFFGATIILLSNMMLSSSRAWQRYRGVLPEALRRNGRLRFKKAEDTEIIMEFNQTRPGETTGRAKRDEKSVEG